MTAQGAAVGVLVVMVVAARAWTAAARHRDARAAARVRQFNARAGYCPDHGPGCNPDHNPTCWDLTPPFPSDGRGRRP